MTTRARVTVQRATHLQSLPSNAEFTCWVEAALHKRRESAEVTIRLVDEDESAALNNRYRHMNKPTNVLSFPAELPAGVESFLLGDLVICAPLVVSEAVKQGKAAEAHWAHLTIHGILHLHGYDHERADEAQLMESLEIAILHNLGFANPYDPHI